MPRKKKIESVVEEIKTDVQVAENETLKEESKPSKKKEEKTKMITVIKPRVNVRKTPSLLGEILGIVAEGEKFELLEKESNGGFYCINYKGTKAYIMVDLVK